jgi:Zn-dependent peptidase ImmA (M78 family)
MSGLFLHHASFGMAILVNAKQARSRQLFSYAHEYAHAIFDQRRQYVVSDSTNISDPIETRANAFAAAFLMPREGVIESIHQLGKGLPNRHIFTVYDEANDEIIEAENRHQASSQKLTPQNIALIAHHFGVSYQATVYRLQSLRQISPKEKDELLQEESIGKEYLKILNLCEESRELPFQTELTARLSHLILEAYQQEKISRERVLEMCKLLSLPSKQLMENALQ